MIGGFGLFDREVCVHGYCSDGDGLDSSDWLGGYQEDLARCMGVS